MHFAVRSLQGAKGKHICTVSDLLTGHMKSNHMALIKLSGFLGFSASELEINEIELEINEIEHEIIVTKYVIH